MGTVFTNGCFDILHAGHLSLLNYIRKKYPGDKVIVGLNSDSSVKRQKGPARPIMNQKERKETLLLTTLVDEVIIFTEDTPIGLIEAIQPDVIVKGPDYSHSEVVGSDKYKIDIAPRDVNVSTSYIIRRILNSDHNQ